MPRRQLPPIDWFVRVCVLIALPLIAFALVVLAFIVEGTPIRNYSPDGRPIVTEFRP